MDPSHITEFASERYFSKLKQLGGRSDQTSTDGPSTTADTAIAAPIPPAHAHTFILPLGRQRSHDNEPPPLALRPRDQKKRSLGHDLSALRTQRRPTFSGSFGSLRSKVTVIHKPTSIVEHHEEILAENPTEALSISLSDLFLRLPIELQAQIIAPLPIHTILELRLVSKSFHTVVTLNESPIARYHIANSLPQYAVRLYPLPDPSLINLHHLCGLWHRLNVAEKLATRIAAQATKEIFLRNTEVMLREFEPQHRRMRQRLTPLIFTLFHFFETYRDLHVRHLMAGGTPLSRQVYTLNPLECQVMAMYDAQTLLQVHQVFPLVISSFSRRLRPPSYVGSIEGAFKGYLKGRPADEVYATIISVGGLRQAQRFWETKGYNSRRQAVDIWYGFVTRSPVEAPVKSKMSLISHLGRKKHTPPPEASTESMASHNGNANVCKEWFCVKPNCQSARKRHSTDNLVFHSSLSAGPPMAPLTREQLKLVLPDLQLLTDIWARTAEALLLERGIVKSPKEIKRNTQMLLELIKDDGRDDIDDWSAGNALVPTRTTASMEDNGSISD